MIRYLPASIVPGMKRLSSCESEVDSLLTPGEADRRCLAPAADAEMPDPSRMLVWVGASVEGLIGAPHEGQNRLPVGESIAQAGHLGTAHSPLRLGCR